MKLNALILCCLPAFVFASDTVEIHFEVTADAAACTPVLSNGGVADFGSRYSGSLSQKAFTQLGTRDLLLTITCESSTGVAVTARDTRASSVTVGKDESGEPGVRFVVNNGGYVSEPSRLFGMGLSPEGKAIGSYGVQINNSAVTATDNGIDVSVEMAGADTKDGPWNVINSLPLPTSQDYFYTFMSKGSSTPQPISTATIPLQVSASIAPGLNSGQKIQLDGEAVISLVYL